MPRTLEHLRCPCCGKLSRGQNYGQAGTAEGHLLEVATQHFIGGQGRGFRWTRREVDVRDLPVLELLLAAVERVRKRLALAIEFLKGKARSRSESPQYTKAPTSAYQIQEMPLAAFSQSSSVQDAGEVEMYERVATPFARRVA
jgi:hypothetical protein